jgi:hypothetical protein
VWPHDIRLEAKSTVMLEACSSKALRLFHLSLWIALVHKDKKSTTSSVANHRNPLGAARFQPNISSHQRCGIESRQDKAALKS